MALDEALLGTAADLGVATLRFYTWSVPTLSLGYFQPHAPPRAALPLPFVRRASGGAALVHHHELTYALALPPGRDWQPPGSWICRFHHVIRLALEGVGIDSHLCQQEVKKGEILCFLHHTPGDLLLGDHKVAGSAQRKTRGAILQHGGILIAASPHTPQLPGINDLSPHPFPMQKLERAVLAALVKQTGWRLEPGAFTEEERMAAATLHVERYLSAEWNEKR